MQPRCRRVRHSASKDRVEAARCVLHMELDRIGRTGHAKHVAIVVVELDRADHERFDRGHRRRLCRRLCRRSVGWLGRWLGRRLRGRLGRRLRGWFRRPRCPVTAFLDPLGKTRDHPEQQLVRGNDRLGARTTPRRASHRSRPRRSRAPHTGRPVDPDRRLLREDRVRPAGRLPRSSP